MSASTPESSLKRIRAEKQVPTGEVSEDDSYDEENQLTKVKIGRIPYGWYEEFKHFGYDKHLQKVTKKKQQDSIAEFIRKSENKDWWRTIRDELNQRDIRLNDKQLELIDRIRSGKMASKTVASSSYQFTYDYNDPFPLNAHPPAKRNFMPSKWEQMKINKILDGLLTGRIKWNPEEEEEKEEELFDAWASGAVADRGVINIAPMKQKLPGHNESYNPPKEYLLSQEQLKEWQQLDEEDRPYNFIPTAFDKIRHIPLYDKLIQERFQRCLDLYLCPRIKKKKLNIDPEALIPKLPDASTLRPFPTSLNVSFMGHNAAVISLATSPQGTYFASGDESGLIIIWETQTSKSLWQKQYQQPILSIDWNLSNVLAFSHGEQVQIMVWKYSKLLKSKGDGVITQAKESAANSNNTEWTFYSQDSEEYAQGLRITFKLQSDVTHLEFQKTKGDYLVSVCPDNAKKNEVVAIHRLSKAATQTNFIKGSGIFKSVSFYPKKPQIVILTTGRAVVFNLQEMATAKKLSSGDNTYSTMAVHPLEPYIMVGSDNSKLLCFDLDLSAKPYKSMTFHEKGVTTIHFHPEYPLMASASNDATIHVFHFKGQSDTLQQAVILPLKVLRGHSVRSMQGVKVIRFHPKQPWLISAGKDGKVLLWT